MLSPGVGVAGVLVEAKRVLLVLRGQSPAKGLWSFPGGRVELAERLEEAVRRELREECGIEVAVGSLVDAIDAIEGKGESVSHWVLAIFRVERVEGEIEPGDDAVAARWVTLDELRQLPTAPRVLDIAERVLSEIPATRSPKA